MTTFAFEVLPWLALVVLSLGYWSQVWKTHVHKEVRDLSIASYIFLAIGFTIMGARALYDGSVLFFTKQLVTLIPVGILIFQIRYHRDDRWHDDADEMCLTCDEELEPQWSYCPYCSTATMPHVAVAGSPSHSESEPRMRPERKDRRYKVARL